MARRIRLGMVLLFAGPALLVACGDDSGGSGDTAASTSTAPPTSAAASTSTALSVVVGTDEEPSIATATLTVAPDGTATGTGYLADPETAARAAALVTTPAAVKRLTEGEPGDQACTEIYGGPDVGLVTGTVNGQAVDTRFHRSNGCGIADWQLFEPLLGRSHWNGDQRIYFEGESPISVATGTEFFIELAANATTGYEWQPVVPEGAPVEIVGSNYVAPDTGLVGAGGYAQFTLRGTAAGSTTVVFEYRRSFEPDNPPADTASFTIDVTA